MFGCLGGERLFLLPVELIEWLWESIHKGNGPIPEVFGAAALTFDALTIAPRPRAVST